MYIYTYICYQAYTGDFGQVMSSIEMAANCHKDDARGLQNVSGWFIYQFKPGSHSCRPCHCKTRGYAAGSEAAWCNMVSFL